MNFENVDWMSIFVNWFPMLLLIGLWMYFMFRMRGRGFVDLQRRNVEAMERIAAALEKMAKT